MELLLKINTWAIAITFVFFIITLIRIIRSKKAKPSKTTWRIAAATIFAAGVLRIILEIWCGNKENALFVIHVMLGIAYEYFWGSKLIATSKHTPDTENK